MRGEVSDILKILKKTGRLNNKEMALFNEMLSRASGDTSNNWIFYYKAKDFIDKRYQYGRYFCVIKKSAFYRMEDKFINLGLLCRIKNNDSAQINPSLMKLIFVNISLIFPISFPEFQQYFTKKEMQKIYETKTALKLVNNNNEVVPLEVINSLLYGSGSGRFLRSFIRRTPIPPEEVNKRLAKREEQIKIVWNMLKKGLNPQEINEMTGISVEDIEKLILSL